MHACVSSLVRRINDVATYGATEKKRDWFIYARVSFLERTCLKSSIIAGVVDGAIIMYVYYTYDICTHICIQGDSLEGAGSYIVGFEKALMRKKKRMSARAVSLEENPATKMPQLGRLLSSSLMPVRPSVLPSVCRCWFVCLCCVCLFVCFVSVFL